MGWEENNALLYGVSAAVSGAACNFITNPLWIIRTRMQSEIFLNPSSEHFKRKYSHGPLSIITNMREVVRSEGFRSLFKGLSATMLGVIHPIIFFPLYEKLKIFFKDNYEPEGSKSLSPKYIVASTITAKVSASMISYPHEVLRSRLQFNKDIKVDSLYKLIVRMVKNEGVASLYSGYLANIARIIPNYAIIFVIYESLCEM